MEESIKELGTICRACSGGDADIRTYSPLTLAYIGDAVFELIIRTFVVEQGQCPANKLHKHTTSIVCAKAQAKMIASVGTPCYR